MSSLSLSAESPAIDQDEHCRQHAQQNAEPKTCADEVPDLVSPLLAEDMHKTRMNGRKKTDDGVKLTRDKAPDPDGLIAEFFIKARSIVGEDFKKILRHLMFEDGDWARINKAFITLISKSEGAMEMGGLSAHQYDFWVDLYLVKDSCPPTEAVDA
ncbi:ribonuclease H [Canna indica]|uniref:Ribonuclease H n=1 Tax=Canna indica TaxID=4628 RepID=A0AAQ3L486_9LILI|nr:ribonuclease H [Canna indica]